jgi:hypothetical protein
MLDVVLLPHRHPPGPFLLSGRQSRRSPTGDSPETRRSTSDRRSEVLRRDYGETTAIPARVTEAVSERIAGGLIIVIWQPHRQAFSASHWNPGTSVADDSRRRHGAKSLLGVQISIPGTDRVRRPWCMGVLRQFSQTIQRAFRAGATLAQHVRVDHRRRDVVVAGRQSCPATGRARTACRPRRWDWSGAH